MKKYYVRYSFTSVELQNTEEQGVIECRNLIHAVVTYICVYHGAYEEIIPVSSCIMAKLLDLKLSIEKY